MQKKEELLQGFSLILHNKGKIPLIITFSAFCLLIFAATMVMTWYIGVQDETRHASVSLETSRIGILLEKSLSRRLDLIDGMDAFVHANPSRSELDQTFHVYASALNTSVHGIEFISLAPDNIQNYVYPVTGNEEILGHDLLNQSRSDMQVLVQEAIMTGRPNIASPHRRWNNDLILIGRKPVMIDGYYWGLVTVSVDLSPVFEEIGLNGTSGNYQIAIRDKSGRTFFGNSSVFSGNPSLYRISLYDQYWEVGGIPLEKTGNSQFFPLLMLKTLLAIIIILVTILVYGVVSRQMELSHAVEERTAELRELNKQLSVEIDNRHRYEAALIQTNKKIQVFSQLTRTDIANQIFVIGGFLDLIDDIVENKNISIYLKRIHESIGFIAARLEFSAQFQDLGKEEPEWHSLASTISFALSHLETTGVRRDIDTNGIEIYADSLLERAFFNIFQNSFIHGRNISLIRVTCMIEDHELLIVIQDDGVGVDDAQKEIIFTKGIGSSSHFGLFFTREILSITGITITETGKAGEGAVFQIRVPKQGYRIIGGCTGSTPV